MIRGWLSDDEAKALAAAAAGKRVLELGTYCGKSTLCMAERARIVHTVDWHGGDDGTGPANTLWEFWQNLRASGLREKVIVHVGRIEEIVGILKPSSFDMAFIDSAHDAGSVIRDARIASEAVRNGGTLAFHDWSQVSDFLKELLKDMPPLGKTDSLYMIANRKDS